MYAVSVNSLSSAWSRFAAGAAAFGAPVPTALVQLTAAGAAPGTLLEALALIDDAFALANDDDACTIGAALVEPSDYAATGREGAFLVTFGTGRSQAELEIWPAQGDLPAQAWLQATAAMGRCSDPSAIESMAASLRTRRTAMGLDLPREPGQTIEVADVEIFRRSEAE